ncbi:MAG: hypothetical protein NC131_05315 [Roseburia sp.]|nr:hypothetical protein [Roseburia sp.]
MNKDLFLQKAEQYLNDILDKNIFSFELDNGFNDYYTFIYMKVLKNGNFIKIGCSYYDNKINFWNSFDEEFVQPLSIDGLAEILKIALKEKSVEYCFSFVYNGWAEYSMRLKTDNIEKGVILHELTKFLSENEIKYDYIIFSDFFGRTTMKIVFNAKTEKFDIL